METKEPIFSMDILRQHLVIQAFNGYSNTPNNLPIQEKGAALIYGVLTMFISAVQTVSKPIMKKLSLYFPEIACLMVAKSFKAYSLHFPLCFYSCAKQSRDFHNSVI